MSEGSGDILEQEQDKTRSRKKSTADWVERTPGRRPGDHVQCAMHDYLTNKNEHCFDIIKGQIKEEVRRRDQKIDQVNERINHVVTYAAAGLITSIAMALLGTILVIMSVQLSDMKQTNKETSKVLSEVIIGQQTIVKQFDRFAPEHELLMQHLREAMSKE